MSSSLVVASGQGETLPDTTGHYHRDSLIREGFCERRGCEQGRMARMPRRGRWVIPEVPCHVTQRGVDRCATLSVSADHDRITYLRLLRDHLADAGVRILGWCLMTNHAHLIAVPQQETSLSVLFRRLHGRYAQYFNACSGRRGTCGR